MRILAIETSCDETGIAIVEASGGLKNPRFRVLENLVASQIKIHRPFGGVVPNLAKREHIKNLPLLWRRIMKQEARIKNKKRTIHDSRFMLPKIDLITVTVGPGLEPALWAGITFAKQLRSSLKNAERTRTNAEKSRRKSALSLRQPAPKLVGVNHLEGHLYSFLLPQKTGITNYQLPITKIFPAIALIVSGGHTILLHLESFSKWKLIGETRDDAVGEAFDKVARLLDLPYPGGPEIEKLASYGNSFAITFPRPMLDQKNYDFSFSGLKTAVLYYLRDKKQVASDKEKADIAASFQQAATDVLVAKTKHAAEEYGAESILLSGGVAANKHLRKALKRAAELIGVKFFVADAKYNLDNAAMIGAAGYMALLRSRASGGQAHLRKKKYPLVARGDMGI